LLAADQQNRSNGLAASSAGAINLGAGTTQTVIRPAGGRSRWQSALITLNETSFAQNALLALSECDHDLAIEGGSAPMSSPSRQALTGRESLTFQERRGLGREASSVR